MSELARAPYRSRHPGPLLGAPAAGRTPQVALGSILPGEQAPQLAEDPAVGLDGIENRVGRVGEATVEPALLIQTAQFDSVKISAGAKCSPPQERGIVSNARCQLASSRLNHSYFHLSRCGRAGLPTKMISLGPPI